MRKEVQISTLLILGISIWAIFSVISSISTFFRESGDLARLSSQELYQRIDVTVSRHVAIILDEKFDFGRWSSFLEMVKGELAEELRKQLGFGSVDRLQGNRKFQECLDLAMQRLESAKETSLDRQRLIAEGKLKSQRQIEIEKEQERKDREMQLAQEKVAVLREEASALLEQNPDLVRKFIEIAFRAVTKKDAYGQEQPELLDKHLDGAVHKLMIVEGYSESDVVEFREYKKQREKGKWAPEKNGHRLRAMPEKFRFVKAALKSEYEKYYERNRVGQLESTFDIEKMTGIEFENYLAARFSALGYSVTTTPPSGDQGCDLLIEKSGRKFVIQAKRYSGNVGNKAIQEVVAAKNFYHAHAGAVVTNSLFTKSAVALAEANEVTLVDGVALLHLEDYF